jgi:hypothetical protein
MSLLRAIREHLTIPGDDLPKLREMYTALTEQDKADLSTYFGAIGIEIVPA